MVIGDEFVYFLLALVGRIATFRNGAIFCSVKCFTVASFDQLARRT
jgi:hypothetical protein